jgi:hypothetical protein
MPCASSAVTSVMLGGGGAFRRPSRRSAPRSAAQPSSRLKRAIPDVAIGIYATVLFVLGMADRLGNLAAPKNDPVGLQLEEENLPQRIRVARSPKRTKSK